MKSNINNIKVKKFNIFHVQMFYEFLYSFFLISIILYINYYNITKIEFSIIENI